MKKEMLINEKQLIVDHNEIKVSDMLGVAKLMTLETKVEAASNKMMLCEEPKKLDEWGEVHTSAVKEVIQIMDDFYAKLVNSVELGEKPYSPTLDEKGSIVRTLLGQNEVPEEDAKK